MAYHTKPKLLTLYTANHELCVIARREANRRRRADRRGNPGKKTPQALLIYNAYLFFNWITTLLDSAFGINLSACDDIKPNFSNIYKMHNKNYGVV
jgi:hypothetical protein